MEMGSPNPDLEQKIDFVLGLMKGEVSLSVYDMTVRQQTAYIQLVVSTLRPAFHAVRYFEQLGRTEARNRFVERCEYGYGLSEATRCINLSAFDPITLEEGGRNTELSKYLYLSRNGDLVLRQTSTGALHDGSFCRAIHSFCKKDYGWLEEQLATELDAGLIVQALTDLVEEDTQEQESRLADRRKVLQKFVTRTTGLIQI
jgi:hypothetical protein